MKISVISGDELNEKSDIIHFKAHKFSALCYSLLKANFVIGFLCVATHPEFLLVSSVSKISGVDGSPRLVELDAQGVAPHLTVKKSVTESVFCVWVTTVMHFFNVAWCFKAFLPMLFAHSLHFVLWCSGTDVT